MRGSYKGAHAMRRRDFLTRSGRFAIVASAAYPMANVRVTRAADASSAADTLISSLEASLPNLLKECVVPGLSIAVIKDGRQIWSRGFGVRNARSREPVDADTVFEAASVSKTVFAYAALKACEEKVIGLDAPLSSYAKTPFIANEPRIARVTARHVLSHTAGFPDWRSSGEVFRIHSNPGEKFHYSGEGYYYLQSILSQLRGKVDSNDCGRYEADYEVCATDIDAYLKQNLLVPFGMRSSGYVWSEFFEKHAADPHDTQGAPSPKAKPNARDAARYASAGGLHTTAGDYARFLIEIMEAREQDASHLGRKSLEEMQKPQIKLPPDELIDGATAWGLGWGIQQRENGNVLVHSGGQTGFRALAMASVPRRSGFIILTNSDNGGKLIYHPAVMEALNRLF